jgi:acetoacetate decarboxylase
VQRIIHNNLRHSAVDLPGNSILVFDRDCEYVTTDVAMALARELWGYPKKLAAIGFEESKLGIVASVTRLGMPILRVDFSFGGGEFEHRPNMMPRLQRKRVPRADGQGFDIDQIITNEVGDYQLLEFRPGAASVSLGASEADPLDELYPLESLGAEFVVANFSVGYCRVFEDLLQRQ